MGDVAKEVMCSMGNSLFRDDLRPGAKLGNLRGGGAGIYYRKDDIIHFLSPSVKCVAPLLR